MIELLGAPKVELHVHLEGAMRPATLLELAGRNNVELPFSKVEDIERWYRFDDFPQFAAVYKAISRSIVSAADLEYLARDFIRGQAAQNVVYTEVTYTALTPHRNYGLSFDEQYAALERVRMWAERELDVSFGVIIDIPRDYATDEQSAMVADWVANSLGETVVALGLAGYETGYPPEQFSAAFARARAAGVPAICHAGETEGPQSIRGALDLLGSRRLGHGVRCLEDEALVERLRREQIVLEVCPSSEVSLGVFSSLAEHPLARLVEEGLAVTINSDDPAMFATTLTRELELARSRFGLSDQDLGKAMVLAAEASLAGPRRKPELVRRIREGWEL